MSANRANISAYNIGNRLLQDSMEKTMQKAVADLAMQSALECHALQHSKTVHEIDWKQTWYTKNAQGYFEYYKTGIVSGTEATTQQANWDESGAKWPLDIYQHGANLLASVSGGTVPTGSSTLSDVDKTLNVVGSSFAYSFTGFKWGAYAGGAPGAIVGAIVGGIFGGLKGWADNIANNKNSWVMPLLTGGGL